MKLISIIISLMLSVVVVYGADVKKDAVFWGTLQGKVQKLSSSRKIAASATVAGVKGAKNDRADIYWKGKDKKNDINEEELLKFNTALEQQSNGNVTQALKHFETFLQEFPNSTLHAEGREAVQLLKAELSPQKSEAAATPSGSIIPAESAAIPALTAPAIPAVTTTATTTTTAPAAK